MREKYIIRLAQANDRKDLIGFIAEFRQSLAELRGKAWELDIESADRELTTYQGKEFPIYVAENQAGRAVGYLVCRVDAGVVWAESLYVSPTYRRQGVGSLLYAEGERLADELGSETLYNWADPNNDGIISFLQKRGYNVLNLIELRRKRPGEDINGKIRVGSNEFDCS